MTLPDHPLVRHHWLVSKFRDNAPLAMWENLIRTEPALDVPVVDPKGQAWTFPRLMALQGARFHRVLPGDELHAALVARFPTMNRDPDTVGEAWAWMLRPERTSATAQAVSFRTTLSAGERYWAQGWDTLDVPGQAQAARVFGDAFQDALLADWEDHSERARRVWATAAWEALGLTAHMPPSLGAAVADGVVSALLHASHFADFDGARPDEILFMLQARALPCAAVAQAIEARLADVVVAGGPGEVDRALQATLGAALGTTVIAALPEAPCPNAWAAVAAFRRDQDRVLNHLPYLERKTLGALFDGLVGRARGALAARQAAHLDHALPSPTARARTPRF